MRNNFFQLYKRYHNIEEKKHDCSNNQNRIILQANKLNFSWRNSHNPLHTAFSNDTARKESTLYNISFSLKQGEIISVFGKTGTGKTTLAKLLVGRERATSGSIVLNNITLPYGMSRKELYVRANIQLMPQIPSLSFHPMMSIRRSFEDAFTLYQVRMQKISKIDNSISFLDFEKKFLECIDDLCVVLHLDPQILTRLPSKVSGGQLQRCALIRALLVFPQVLVLDEPVSHLDVKVRIKTLAFIRMIQEYTTLGIILISHLPEVHRYFSVYGNCSQYEIQHNTLSLCTI